MKYDHDKRGIWIEPGDTVVGSHGGHYLVEPKGTHRLDKTDRTFSASGGWGSLAAYHLLDHRTDLPFTDIPLLGYWNGQINPVEKPMNNPNVYKFPGQQDDGTIIGMDGKKRFL